MEERGFKHSVRVPRLYKVASSIYRDHVSGKGTIKNLIYEGRHPRVNALLSIVTECATKKDEIEEIIEKSNLLVEEPRFDPYLARILITELIWGKGTLSGKSRPEEVIMKRAGTLKKISKEMGCTEKKKNSKPRWARINTLKISVHKAIQHFTEVDGLTYLEYYTDIEYKDFIDKVKHLQPHEFMCDLHVDNLLIFHPSTAFYSHELYINGSVILQDKASTLPIQALNIKEGSIVMDACAAPGNKTTQIASAVGLNGGVYAIERDEARSITLKQTLERAGIDDSLVQVINMDFTTLNPEDYPDVEYIVLDPSCSSTGIIDDKVNKERIAKLASFQCIMLRHALKFPNVKKISYSTCSVHKMENEEVVEAILREQSDFKVTRCLKSWPTRGLDDFPIGKKCVRAFFDSDLCSGFFVATLKRVESHDTTNNA